jgi:UDP-glucose 4-epimerase
MRYLVTGGGGFIGSHLSEFLIDQGADVVVIDDFSTGRYENIASLERQKNFELIVDTVLKNSLVEELVRSSDFVFHLASAVGVRLIIQEPVRTIHTIIEGTRIVLDHARRYRKKVLITSSSEVYGKSSKTPFSEEDDTVSGPTTTRRWAYAAAKALDEFLAFAHWYDTRLPVICVRLFNTVGPRQTGQYGMVLPNFVKQALDGKPITVYGNGQQTRSFCHVKDVVPALENLIKCNAAYGKVVNIGNSEEVTINHLASRVKELAGSKSPIVHVPYKEAYVEGFEDMRQRTPDVSLARRLIGFNPTNSLDDIIKSVIAYFREEAS